MLLVAARVHWRCIQGFVLWVHQYCGTSEVFVLHVLRCALFLPLALVAWAARAETHVAAKKESRDHLGSRKNTGTPGATKSTGTAI